MKVGWLNLLHLYSLVSIECVGEMQDFLGKGNELFAVCVRHWAILENIHTSSTEKICAVRREGVRKSLDLLQSFPLWGSMDIF